jgi:hypothetical protein
MSERDLGEELENIEGELDNLKNKEFKLFGIKMTPMTISAALAGIGTIVGSLYGGFLMYQKVEQAIEFVDQQQEYEEKIAGFEQRMELIDQKVSASDENLYAIKSDLKTDIRRVEGIVDGVERDAKQTMKDVDGELRTFRTDVKDLTRNVESELKTLRKETETQLDALEARVEDRIQKALDNPLAN